MATSENGWGADNPPRSARTVPGSGVTLTLRTGPAGDLLVWVAEQLDKRVEDLDLKSTRGEYDDWGFAARNIRGSTTSISNHSSATAFDMNATRHPLGVRNTFTAAQEREIRAILAEVGAAVRWGGDYTGRVDEMHFEIRPGTSEARCAQVLATARTQRVTNADQLPTLAQGDQGDAVKRLQLFCNAHNWTPNLPLLTVDGDYGPATVAVIKAAQGQLGITGPDADGQTFGPRTKAAFWRVGYRG